MPIEQMRTIVPCIKMKMRMLLFVFTILLFTSTILTKATIFKRSELVWFQAHLDQLKFVRDQSKHMAKFWNADVWIGPE